MFSDEFKAFQEEMEQYYSTYPIEVPEVEARIEALVREHPEATPFEEKAFIYQAAAEMCEPHIFRTCPFYYELVTGRDRNGITAGFPPEPGIGGAMMRRHSGIEEEFHDWYKDYLDAHLIQTIFFGDFSHYAVACDNIFREGLGGMRKRAEEARARCDSEWKRGFYSAMITGLTALITISRKFAQKAEEMLEDECDPAMRSRLLRIAQSARYVPEHPPRDFYEALNTIWFMKELMIAMEGVGMAVVGHLDRLLWPYYQKDLAEGRITRQEAKDMLACFLAITDYKWDLYVNAPSGGVNTTVVIGGSEGNIVFNDLTRMICEAYQECRLVDPKLQARISAGHPEAYFRLLADIAASGLNVLSIFNDDTMIPAQVAAGKAVEYARLYEAGGCQEPVLPNVEDNVRANCYINLPMIVNTSLAPQTNLLWQREGLDAWDAGGADTFERFYQAVIHNLEITCHRLAEVYNRFQDKWTGYSPLPLYSATITGCIESGRDLTEGGAKYNYNSLSPTGIGTMIDSLYAIRKAVFEDGYVTLNELTRALQTNFEGAEALCLYLRNRVPKFGDDDEELNRFAGRVMRDVARVSSGMPNNRGGIYEASLFSNMGYLEMRDMDATADGRRKGETLSRGMGPSDQGGAGVISKVIHSMEHLPLDRYPASAVLYLDMPYSPGQTDKTLIESVIRYFISNGGNVLDLNLADVNALKDAKVHPENHQGLVVRVWGFSAYFVTLEEKLQDEIIARQYKQ